jgi:hypothetical protein
MTAIARYLSSLVSKIHSGLSNGSLASEAIIGSMNLGKGLFTWRATIRSMASPPTTKSAMGEGRSHA